MPHQFKEEFDFRDLLRTPARLFGYSYIYFVVITIGIGLLYLYDINAIGKNAVPGAVFADTSARVRDIPLETPRTIPPVDVMNAGVSSPELVARGRTLFAANCASCHGDNGMGDGPAGLVMNPKPRNFHSLMGWTNGSRVSQIYTTLQEGIVRNGMASYSYLPPEDRFALAHYVRSFASGQPMDTPDELKQLDVTYGLSKGMDVAGQIPVARASQIVEREAIPDVQFAEELTSLLGSSSDPGAELLRLHGIDRTRMTVTIMHARRRVSSPDELAAMITTDPNVYGFDPSVRELNHQEWSAVYRFTQTQFRER